MFLPARKAEHVAELRAFSIANVRTICNSSAKSPVKAACYVVRSRTYSGARTAINACKLLKGGARILGYAAAEWPIGRHRANRYNPDTHVTAKQLT